MRRKTIRRWRCKLLSFNGNWRASCANFNLYPHFHANTGKIPQGFSSGCCTTVGRITSYMSVSCWYAYRTLKLLLWNIYKHICTHVYIFICITDMMLMVAILNGANTYTYIYTYILAHKYTRWKFCQRKLGTVAKQRGSIGFQIMNKYEMLMKSFLDRAWK